MVDDRVAKLEREVSDLRDRMDVTMTFAMIALHESRYKVGPLRDAWDAWRENLSDREASAALDRELDAMAEAVSSAVRSSSRRVRRRDGNHPPANPSLLGVLGDEPDGRNLDPSRRVDLTETPAT